MSGYNVLIPDICRQQSPQVTLPVMDALQSMGHSPVTLSMIAINDMYQTMRYQRHGCYEIFQFYVQDLVRKGNINFGFSAGLTIVLEDPAKSETHHLLEECDIPNIVYLHTREHGTIAKLLELGAVDWQHTYITVTSSKLATLLEKRGVKRVVHIHPGVCPRIFFPADHPPVNAAYDLKPGDERLAADYDVSFAGSCTPQREHLLVALKDAGVRLAIFGGEDWRESALSGQWRGKAGYITELNTVFAASKLVLDLPHEQSIFPDYISVRVFDSLASGRALVTYRRVGLDDVVDSTRDVISFDDTGELVKAVKYYLEHDEERLTIAQRGHRRIMEQGRWEQRLDCLIPQLEMHLLACARA